MPIELIEPQATWLTADLAITAATAVLAGIVAVLTHSYRRSMRMGLSQARLLAYSSLWQITGVAAPARFDSQGVAGALIARERQRLHQDLLNWYFKDGNGMFLEGATREVFLTAKRNLVCVDKYLKPAGLLKQLQKDLTLDDKQKAEKGNPAPATGDQLRGVLSMRQLSLLRSQLKSDLAIFGDVYVGALSRHERSFLWHCGIYGLRRPWRRAFFHLPKADDPWSKVDGANDSSGSPKG